MMFYFSLFVKANIPLATAAKNSQFIFKKMVAKPERAVSAKTISAKVVNKL